MASFYVIRGKDNGQHFAIRGAQATIGREATNQIQLRDTEVSRRHARIIRTDEANFEIVDNASSNGTYVNGRRVQAQVLKSGDRIQVGRTLLIFTGGLEPQSARSIDDIEIVNQTSPDELSQIRSSIHSRSSLLDDPRPLAASLPDSSRLLDGSSSEVRRQEAALSSKEVPLVDDVSRTSQAMQAQAISAPESMPQSERGHEPALPSASAAPSSLEIVYRVSQAINRTTDLNELLTQVLELIFDWIDCDRGCILMNDDVTDQLTPICSLDRKQNHTKSLARPLTMSRTILDHVVENREGVLTSNAQDDVRWQSAESVARLGVQEAMCVPMLGRYGTVGAIYVDTSVSPGNLADRNSKSTFSEEHLKLMMAIAGQAALAIEDTQFYHAMLQSERLAVMGQTIANLSHHVKNILQGVGGGNYLIEDGIKKNDMQVIQQGWKIVQRNQQRITDLVMDMLTYSKDREPNLRRRDLCPVVDDVVQLMKTRATDVGVQIIWQRPSVSLEADFDEEAIHRALLNVVTNAIDAASEVENGHLKILTEIKDGNVMLTVSDNGPGIAEEDQKRIFAPFESTKGSSGTGLGLPVSRKILREHGGDISVRAQSGPGTAFLLHWPAPSEDEIPATLMDG